MILNYTQYIKESLFNKITGPSQSEVSNNFRKQFLDGKINIFDYYKKAKELNIQGPTKEEIETSFYKEIKNGITPKNLLNSALKLGLFSGVIKAFEESDKLSPWSHDAINVFYIDFNYLNNFKDDEADFIIDKFLILCDYGELLEKSINEKYYHGVERVFNVDEEIRQSKKYQYFLEHKNFHINRIINQCVKDNNIDSLKIILDNADDGLEIPTDTIITATKNNNFKIVELLKKFIK